MFKYTARYSVISSKVSKIASPGGLAALFLGIVLASTSTVHAMSMAPMSMRPEEPLCAVADRRLVDERAQRRALREYENQLIDDLLASRADLNADVGSGGKSLEIVSRAKAIATLLQHGADPRQCQQSSLLHPLLYYISHVDNKIAEDPDFYLDYSVYQQEKMRRDSLRRVMKLFECFKLLLRAGANANQERQGRLPLQTLLRLERDGYCSCINIDSLLKLLIWHGANPGNIERWSARDAYGYRMGLNSFDRLNLRRERQKYEAVCQILMGHKEENSPLSQLPLETVREIIGHVVWGDFKLPRIAAASASDSLPDRASQKEQAPRVEEIHGEKAASTTSVFQRFSSARWKHLLRSRLVMGAASIGLGWWIYKQWQKRKKAKRKEVPELCDRGHFICG